MPVSPKRPCTQPGCTVLVDAGQCQAHQTLNDRRRGTAAERGYDRQWKRFRDWFIGRHPQCEDCKARGRVMETEHVHHVKKLRDNPRLRLDESNCMALCERCHNVRTQRGE